MNRSLPELDFDGLGLNPAHPVPGLEEWRQQVRRFVDRHISPGIEDFNRTGTFPDELYRHAAAEGLLGMGFPESVGGTGENATLQQRMVFAEELHRLGSGVVFADIATHWIALPPVVRQHNERLNAGVVRPVLAGEKKISFAVTEPGGGSDVGSMLTTAERKGDGWRISGRKTLISGLMRADFALVIARTGGEGSGGLSMFLLETDRPGVSREPVPGLEWYNASIGTLAMHEVELPADALIGEENHCFRDLTRQFNIERFSGAAAALALCRVSLADAIAFARERQVFGQRLIDHQVTRHKLVAMLRRLRAAQALLLHCVDKFEAGQPATSFDYADLSLLKIEASKTLEFIARDGLHLMGGSAYAAGARSERIQREARIFALGGGTEEVLGDFIGRQLRF